MNADTEDTLPDDAWKDSFDRLLDQRPILREMNVIKRDVRASFNMNSSYENSYDNSSPIRQDREQSEVAKSLPTEYISPNIGYLQVPKIIQGYKKMMASDVVSTPIKNSIITNPFKCTISPIGPWELLNFKSNNENQYKKQVNELEFNATPIIDKSIVDMECIEYLKTPDVEKGRNPRFSLGTSPFALVRNKLKPKQSQKQVCFAPNKSCENYESIAWHLTPVGFEYKYPPVVPELGLQPGKWQKTLNCLRRTQLNVLENGTNHKPVAIPYHKKRSISAVERPKSLATTTSIAGNRKSICLRPNLNPTETRLRSTYSIGYNNFKLQVLQRCGQQRILAFDSIYSRNYLRNCCKIGEGAFGEVFVYSKPKDRHSDNDSTEKTVLKIIPIEGKELVNGEVQKTFEQILPEIIISMELCGLSDNNRKINITSGFVNLHRVRCVKGRYPSYLQKLWEEYEIEKVTENDNPKCFTSNQEYIVLELAYSGQDLEGFYFKSAEQSFYALQQIILTLAVGENEYQFEHRDLHWGNILVLNTNHISISYKLGDVVFTIPTKGIKITIIDYTLSRMTFNDYCFYNDLSNDGELFIATGDYQFDIYRMMRKVLNNKWETFEPKTNIYWISYIILKLVEGVSYKNTRSKIHLHYLDKLKSLQTSLLIYKSCMDLARDVILL